MDFELIKRAVTGDKEALVKAVMDRKEEFYRLAYVYTYNREDAMDAMAEMIVIVYENIGKLKYPESFYSWSKTILVNCCRKMIKRNSRFVPAEMIPEIAYSEDYENKELRFDLHQHLESLSSRQKEVIKMRYYLDLDYRTIAEILDIPVGTVKSRISLGLKRLKESFGGGYC